MSNNNPERRIIHLQYPGGSPGYIGGEELAQLFKGLSVTYRADPCARDQVVTIVEFNGTTIDSVLDQNLRNKLQRHKVVIKEG